MNILLAVLWLAAADAGTPPPAGGDAPAPADANIPAAAAPEAPATADEVASHLAKGLQYLEVGPFNLAADEFSKVLRLDPNQVEANIGKAQAVLKLGDGRSAVRWAKMACTLAPGNALAWQVLGEVYLHESNQDYPRAEEAFREELKADPKSRDARLGLARALSYQKKVEEAVGELSRALQDHPEDVVVKVKLAESYYVLRKLDQAEKLVQQVLEKESDNTDARRVLEQVQGRQAYNFWVLLLAAIVIPTFYFGVKWLKKGRTPKV